MSDQDIARGDPQENIKNGTDYSLYELVDERTAKEPSSEYSSLSVYNMNKENIYEGVSSTRPTTSKEYKKVITLKKVVCFLAISACALVVFACLVAIFGEMALLTSNLGKINAALRNEIQQLNGSIEMVQLNLETSTRELGQTLNNHIQHLNNSLAMVKLDQELSNNATQLLAQILLDEIGRSQNSPASSCAAVKALSPSIPPTGYYWVRASNGSAVRVYCDMTRSCGGVFGGWMRVAELDMTRIGERCPSGLQRNDNMCRRNSTSAGCSEVAYPTLDLSYSKICGKIIASRSGTPDGFSLPPNIDGVQLKVPGYHIWTFAASRDEDDCQCSKTTGLPPPAEVKNDYFCDSGRGLIWNGDCASSNTCCSFNNPPWFYRELPQLTTDGIEMRVCRDEDRSNEDIGIQIIQIYIQ